MTTIMINDNEDFNAYFWLGEDGEANEVSETEFEDRQDVLRQNLEDWINVRITTKLGRKGFNDY
jgi:hypothetical protein